MNHKEVIASIKVTPSSQQGKSDIRIEMPIWIRRDEKTNRLYANVALLGGIMTYANTEEDLDIALNEAVTAFFEAAQKHGKGFRKELIDLGWQVKKTTNRLRYKVRRDRNPISYGLPESPAFKEVMQTGVSKSLSVRV